MTEQEAVCCLKEQIKIQPCGNVALAFELAIKALEKQIAKKVHIPPCNACGNKLCDCECEHFGTEWIDNFKCPTCESGKVYVEEYGIMYNYCPNCGQKLDWSEV